jgi:squalene synthase HpnC
MPAGRDRIPGMAAVSFAADLSLLGPDSAAAVPCPLDEAQRYCRRLARAHYENFAVASWLLPRALRQHFYNVYAYCRWADDLADETGDPARALALLDWWECELRACFAGQARHPVFVALRETIDEFAIPIGPLSDLLVAFRQDQRITRYEKQSDVLDYCRYSANPVGRLVLYLGRCHDERRGVLADAICTGLQLANFCQDVARDWDKGRIYLPLANCAACGYNESMFAARQTNDAFRAVLAGQVAVAETYLRLGAPLASQMPPALAADVELFAAGGLAVLRAIRRIDYDVWRVRPTVSRSTQLGLLARCLWRRVRNR